MNKGVRIANYIVDFSLIGIVSFITFAIIPMPFVIAEFLFPIIAFLYYFLFEVTTGQTLGKKITKTIVVDLENKKPTVFRIFLRTLMRFNPIDSFSYLYGQEQGSHDVLSRTRLKYKKDIT
jgi:uncharacterized RDD family membrane protein YckC